METSSSSSSKQTSQHHFFTCFSLTFCCLTCSSSLLFSSSLHLKQSSPFQTRWLVPKWSRRNGRHGYSETTRGRALRDAWTPSGRKTHLKKQALKVKEEERFEKWVATHGVSISSSHPGKHKERMSLWEKSHIQSG